MPTPFCQVACPASWASLAGNDSSRPVLHVSERLACYSVNLPMAVAQEQVEQGHFNQVHATSAGTVVGMPAAHVGSALMPVPALPLPSPLLAAAAAQSAATRPGAQASCAPWSASRADSGSRVASQGLTGRRSRAVSSSAAARLSTRKSRCRMR